MFGKNTGKLALLCIKERKVVHCFHWQEEEEEEVTFLIVRHRSVFRPNIFYLIAAPYYYIPFCRLIALTTLHI